MRGPSYQRDTYLLVLGLLESGLVVLGSGTHEFLLHVVDACPLSVTLVEMTK
jgi:hypothetical protein